MNIEDIRSEFAIIGQGHVYLDSAATSLTPDRVLDRITDYYRTSRANVHRAHHPLAESATERYESARGVVAKWLGTSTDHYVVVFTSGFTAGANLVANLVEGFVDGVVVCLESHHSNILPWTRLSSKCQESLSVLHNMPVDNIPSMSGRRLIALQSLGNVLGEPWPVARLCRQANEQGHWTFLDLAQSASRLQHELDLWRPAFAAFSSHKIYGPTGSGAVLVRRDVAESLLGYGNRAPLGGGTVTEVDQNLAPTWAEPPGVWEAGTPNLAGVDGMVSAIQWMQELGMENIAKHDREITAYLSQLLETVPGMEIIGAGAKIGLVSFNITGLNPEDIARSLGAQRIAVRAGGLCANPMLKTHSTGSAVRASTAVYTCQSDIDKLITALEKTVHRLQAHERFRREI
jgi:cysteine desulfurase/selenocysteine lyase